MSVRLEHLRADIFDPTPLARAALSGQLPRHLLRVPRTLADLRAGRDPDIDAALRAIGVTGAAGPRILGAVYQA